MCTFFYISWDTTSLQDAYEGDNVWGKAVTLHMLEGTKASWTWLCLVYPSMSTFQGTIFCSGRSFNTFSTCACIPHLTYLSMKVPDKLLSPHINCVILSWIGCPICVVSVPTRQSRLSIKLPHTYYFTSMNNGLIWLVMKAWKLLRKWILSRALDSTLEWPR